MKKISVFLPVMVCALLLNGCSWFDKSKVKELPPIQVTPEINVQKVWQTSVGNGTDKQYLVLTPKLADGRLYVDDFKGDVMALNPQNGSVIWKTRIPSPITSAPAVGQQKVVVGTGDAQAYALDANTGKVLWQAKVPNEVLAAPGIAPGLALIKTIDGQVIALDINTGKEVWSYGLTLPTLILRGGSTPVSTGQFVVVGFANGKLAVLSAANGNMAWQRAIATSQGLSAIQQMVDIDADPIVANGVVYVATYQGSLTALNLQSGQVLWQHDMSAYAGMALRSGSLFVTDAGGHVWAFNPQSGQVQWRQNRLAERQITGPGLSGNELVIGDDQGNLYWLSQQDGHLMAKQVADAKVPFYAPPVGNGNVAYAINAKGKLYAYAVPK